MENQETTEKTPEEQLSIARRLANKYGNEMRLYGMSLEWSSPRSYPDTTSELKSDPEFQDLPGNLRSEILNYGQKMKIFGMGCYQENTYAARFYDECHGQPPQNPLSNYKLTKDSSKSPNQFGD